MEGIVYKVTCSVSGKSYVGQTRRPLKIRWQSHIYDARYTKKTTHFCNAIRKYGEKSFTIEIIDRAITQVQLDVLEKYWINKLGTLKNGYNGTTGGEHPKWKKESREKLSSSLEQTFGRKLRQKAYVFLRCKYEKEDIPWFFRKRHFSQSKGNQLDWQNSARCTEIFQVIDECESLLKNNLATYQKTQADWEMEEAISGLSH